MVRSAKYKEMGMVPQPVRVRDRSTYWVIGLGGPSLGLLLSEVIFSGFRTMIYNFHLSQLDRVPTYLTDLIGLLLLGVAFTIARLDFRTVNVVEGASAGRDWGKSLGALLGFVFGVIIILGGRFAGWVPAEIGVLHVFAWPMLVCAGVIIYNNRK